MHRPAPAQPSVATPPSRNHPCWCGSGKRFKACHGALGAAFASAVLAEPKTPTAEAVAAGLAQAALAAQQADDLRLAESRYRECLALDPNHVDAMHMLGVVRLAAYDFAEAKQLIETAGTSTGWQFSQFRHNYGFLLSTYLPANSARPNDAQRAALADLRLRNSSKDAGPSRPIPVCAVLMHSVASAPFSQAALPVVVHRDDASVALNLFHLTSDHAGAGESCQQVQDRLRSINADYVAFTSADMPVDATRINEVVALLEARRAGWGFSTVALDADAQQVRRQWPVAMIAASAGLNNAQFAEQVSAMCVATPLLPMSIDNLVVRTSLLADVFWKAPRLTDALGELVLALCQRDEPCVCTTAPLLITGTSARTIADGFGQATVAANAAQRDYIVNTLSGVAFANPLAPSFATQGLAFLKRPLRYGAGVALDAATLTNVAARIAASPVSIKPLRDDGFDVVGFARAESGLGENLRALVRACATADIAHSVIDVDIETGIRKTDESMDALIAAAPTFRHQIICVNPDALNEAVHHEGVAAMSSAYKIGYWFWELEKLPPSWARASTALQELWTASEFVRRAVANAVSIPVYKVPTPIRPPQPARPYARREFGLNDDDFVFLFTFAYGSMIARKNPWAVVRAFRAAFPKNVGKYARAKLVIKSVQSELFDHEKTSLNALAVGDPRIVFMDRFMSRDEVMGLQVSADCYVSLHRAEGFGLGMAECMAIGKPVIGTAYSANLDFMNEGNSFLVDYSLIAVKPGEYPDTQDQVWADADIDSAARHMRRVFDDASLRQNLGDAAQKFMREHYSPAAMGAIMRAHLSRLNANRNS